MKVVGIQWIVGVELLLNADASVVCNNAGPPQLVAGSAVLQPEVNGVTIA